MINIDKSIDISCQNFNLQQNIQYMGGINTINVINKVSKNQTVVFRKTVVIKDRVIPLDKIAEWNATIKRWNDACNEQIALKKKSK